MSRALWTRCLVPQADAPVEDRVYAVYDPPLVVPRTRSLPAAARDLAVLPDPRAYRSLSRAGVLLAAVGLPAREPLAPFLERDRYRVGLYGVLDPGPQNYEAARELAQTPPAEFAAAFKRLNHPKRYLAQLVNLQVTQLGVFLDLRGPVDVYCHSTAAARHALEQAELDLSTGAVAAALVCAAFSLEDPLLALRTRLACPAGAVLCEGAAAVLLVPGGAERNGSWYNSEDTGEHFGLAQALIDVARKEPRP